MMDHAGFTMHWNGGANRFPAEDLVDTLHAQAYAYNRNLSVKASNQGQGNSGMGRVLGPRADQYIVRMKVCCLRQRNLIASIYPDGHIIMHKHLNKIVGKRIVIIDDK